MLQKTIAWWKNLKWYWKILAAVLVVLVAILALLRGLVPTTVLTMKQTQALDDLHETQVDTDLARKEEETTRLRAEVKEKDAVVEKHKKELHEIEDRAREDDVELINQAGMSVEELNEWRRRQGR